MPDRGSGSYVGNSSWVSYYARLNFHRAESASPVAADGRIYFQSEEGETTVVAAGPAFRLLAVNALDGAMLASLAVSGGAICIRTDTHLYRVRR